MKEALVTPFGSTHSVRERHARSDWKPTCVCNPRFYLCLFNPLSEAFLGYKCAVPYPGPQRPEVPPLSVVVDVHSLWTPGLFHCSPSFCTRAQLGSNQRRRLLS